MSEYLSACFLLMGSLFIFIGAIGLLKFPSAITRAHALSKAMLLGISLIFLALVVTLNSSFEVMKVLLAIAFLVLTIPIAGHIFAFYSSSSTK